MKVKELIKNQIVLLDGAMGTVLQQKGLNAGELPELWNIEKSQEIVQVHLDYLKAGCDIVTANTFGANILKLSSAQLEEVIKRAIENAKKAIELNGKSDKFVALDIGPSGKLLKPYGDLDFEDAVSVFKQTAILGEKYGADLVIIETFNDLYETKSAILAVKEVSSLPIFVSNAYSQNGKLMTGASPEQVVCTLEGLGVDVIGANCSFGPKELSSIVEQILEISSTPTLFMPNAGIPKIVDGNTVYDVTPEQFAQEVIEVVQKGVRVVGGCCGTTPEHIACLRNKLKGISPKTIDDNKHTSVCSGLKTVVIGGSPIIIGERINPTGKKRFKQALIENDIAYILQEGIKQQDAGSHILDVNVGIPDVDEKKLIKEVVCELQSVVDLPLQIDTSDAVAMENALRRYNGKALINSVNGKKDSMSAIFPLVKKYGGVVVCLTLDENGIPSTAEGRFEIAKKILDTALEYGINKNDLIFDTLCMTISTDKTAAETTVNALKMIKERLGGKTVLGISNVSFGLPDRESVNAKFLSFALSQGLSCAIINPFSQQVMQSFIDYTGYNPSQESITDFAEKIINSSFQDSQTEGSGIRNYIMRGQKTYASREVEELLKTTPPLEIVNNELIPALDEVGKLYEEGKVFLPQLLISAECAKSAFEVIKNFMSQNSQDKIKKAKFVIATVYGDIHDIGKNIVKLLLDNYGFEVIDLGKDVASKIIVDKVIETRSPLCGLSALMTTTVPSMEDTVKQLKEKAPWCKVIVGGAVLNREYADKMGADYYAKDAMSTVRFAEGVVSKI